MDRSTIAGVVGAGTMGSGIAQVAATFGHAVRVFDSDRVALKRSRETLRRVLDRQVEKKRMDAGDADAVFDRVEFVHDLTALKGCGLVVEAIVEDLQAKQGLFAALEAVVPEDCVLATNTSSLSITSVASICRAPGRVLGVHFFNPAPLMPLVEIVPAVQSDVETVGGTRALVDAWGKTTVLAKDTPGFIVNRVARPFYGEALRILDEGIADAATIDRAMTELGGFRMGPFELMDFIGNDVNFTVTETVFEAFYGDPRYRPSFTQKRLVEAGRLGRKTGRGFYDYTAAAAPEPVRDDTLGREILGRILAMLVNEAADALFWNVATRDDIDLAMKKGVNYPKGLLQWGDEIGLGTVLDTITRLQDTYGEDRYRPSPLLRRMVRDNATFYER